MKRSAGRQGTPPYPPSPPDTGSHRLDLGSPQSTVYAFGAIQMLQYSPVIEATQIDAEVFVDSYTKNGVPVNNINLPAIWDHDVDTVTFAWKLDPDTTGNLKFSFTFQVISFG
jgi:hypothetical protein